MTEEEKEDKKAKEMAKKIVASLVREKEEKKALERIEKECENLREQQARELAIYIATLR